jgi:hypothetical protein
MATPIPTRVIPSIEPSPATSRQVERAFRRLLERGARLLPDGTARAEPLALLADGYTPKHLLELFGHSFYLTNVRQNPLLRFFVAHVVPPRLPGRRLSIHPRIFYKDVSLIWRCGSHVLSTEDDFWIGKGDVRVVEEDGHEFVHTVESTTDLPLEMQAALDVLMRRAHVIRRDEEVIARVLRNAPPRRIAPYRDFVEPRRRAAACRRNLVNGGRPIARFRRRHDPDSLVFTPGYEPDFSRGLLDVTRSRSASYGGELERHRILSRNRKIQFLFFSAPRHVWLAPPQALTTELSSYGVRTVDVVVDEDLCIPGYEYHYLDDPDHADSLHTQIPPGFAGEANGSDPDRADASAWLERLPVVREFRRRVLGRSR